MLSLRISCPPKHGDCTKTQRRAKTHIFTSNPRTTIHHLCLWRITLWAKIVFLGLCKPKMVGWERNDTHDIGNAAHRRQRNCLPGHLVRTFHIVSVFNMNAMLTSSCSDTHLPWNLFRISNSRRQVDLLFRVVYVATLWALMKAISFLFPVCHSAFVALQRNPRTWNARMGSCRMCRLPIAVTRPYNITNHRSRRRWKRLSTYSSTVSRLAIDELSGWAAGGAFRKRPVRTVLADPC